MKHLLSLSLLCLSTGAFATNGNHFIGVSPASTSLGGTGVANPTNAIDALHKNAALLHDATIGLKQVNADVSFLLIDNNASGNAGAGAKDSTAAMKFAPSFGASYSVDEDIAVGLAVLTFGGATVDQVGQAELTQLKTRNSLLRLAPAVSYKFSDLVTVGISPYLSYGSLSVNLSSPATAAQSTRAPHAATGFGAQIGAAFHPIKDLTLGLTYNSESNLTYKEIMNLDAFGPLSSAALSGLDDIQAQQPAELALGAGYNVNADILVTADYRFINWNQATAFKELGWQNQHVVALGAQYKMDAWKFRAGFNYAKSPIRDVAAEAGLTPVNFQGHSVFQQSLSMLNIVAFPAIVESHVTFGTGYDVSKELKLDLAFALALKKSITRSGTGLSPLTGTPGAYSFTAEASQWSFGLGATYTL